MAEIKQQSTELKLTVPWGHVAAKTYGSTTGQFVLVVHGLMDNLGSHTRLMKYLPMEYYYVCIDLPGHGRSSHFPSWMTLDILDYANSLYYILEALQWKKCIYLGHSMGAQIGVIFSIYQPHRIEKLIAIDGLLPMFAKSEKIFMENFKDFFEAPIKVRNTYLYTKEEVIFALKNMRYSFLSEDAAEAMFERAVIEVNGKYKYTRDTRLKRKLFTLLSLQQMIYIVRNISVPLYLFCATHGALDYLPDLRQVVEAVNPKSLAQFIEIEGNHDIHNNNPESIAPFICKILRSDNSSKL